MWPCVSKSRRMCHGRLPRSHSLRNQHASASVIRKKRSSQPHVPLAVMIKSLASSWRVDALQRRMGQLVNEADSHSGNVSRSSSPRICSKQLSPTAVARQMCSVPVSELCSANSRPRKAAHAPAFAFSSPYHGNGRRWTIFCHLI
jgi:hypothetical protein